MINFLHICKISPYGRFINALIHTQQKTCHLENNCQVTRMITAPSIDKTSHKNLNSPFNKFVSLAVCIRQPISNQTLLIVHHANFKNQLVRLRNIYTKKQYKPLVLSYVCKNIEWIFVFKVELLPLLQNIKFTFNCLFQLDFILNRTPGFVSGSVVMFR
jgi:hypothetical protein